MADEIQAGDTVWHRPSGETWIVCGVDRERGRVVPCGWPFPSMARLEDCELLEKRRRAGQPGEFVEALLAHGLTEFIEK